MSGAHSSQKGASDSPKLELGTIVSDRVGAGHRTRASARVARALDLSPSLLLLTQLLSNSHVFLIMTLSLLDVTARWTIKTCLS